MAKKIKKGDQVQVISGAQKGEQGPVLRVLHSVDRVVVEGLNKVKKHKKNQTENGIIEEEAPIHISNIKLVASAEPQPE